MHARPIRYWRWELRARARVHVKQGFPGRRSSGSGGARAAQPRPQTRGWFAQDRDFEVDPRGFNVDIPYRRQLAPVRLER